MQNVKRKEKIMSKKVVDWDNCSTIIVGKDASATGKVIMAHNEDTPNCVLQVVKVPRIKHKAGEVLTFADGDAVIPQVEETWAYMWSECRALGGEPFADGFMNEWGVASDSCVSTKESKLEHGEGIGYALRRLIAERAKTAREGVQVAGELVKKFGYRSTRAYHICDKDEGWVFQDTVGNQFVAKRVGDDEIYYMPNWLTIHEVDFSDTEHKNYYWSEDVVKYAIDNGWYTPKTDGECIAVTYKDMTCYDCERKCTDGTYETYEACMTGTPTITTPSTGQSATPAVSLSAGTSDTTGPSTSDTTDTPSDTPSETLPYTCIQNSNGCWERQE